MGLRLKPLRKIKREIMPLPKRGEIVEGKIVASAKNSLFLDLGPKGIGVIQGKEFFGAKGFLKDKEIGDKVLAKVRSLENEEGYRELSIVEASRESAWKVLAEKKEKNEALEVGIKKANKGGLVCEIKGISGFLPASQLNPEHYPKVENGEGSEIAKALQKFVGKTLKLKIISLEPKKEKLILSEKAISLGSQKAREKGILEKYKVGEIVGGKITGVTNFGAFVALEDNLEGLLRASEISDKKVGDPSQILKIGQKVKAKIIEIANNRIYLSLKKT